MYLPARVRQGHFRTLATIAQRFGFSVDDTALIAAHNGWTGVAADDRLDPGTTVIIPSTAHSAG